MEFLGVKLSETNDKQYICSYSTSFLPLKTFGTFGYKSMILSITEIFTMVDSKYFPKYILPFLYISEVEKFWNDK